ncbi:MAG: hypothetical protein JWL89_517, partial [Candidatus Saccharibacteria bacterium]|nr:hypothetical protein [Candidatus Saccharibacteria bacterium]
TLSALVYVLYRIERRPLVLGTLLLALASILLLVPAQPYPGGILPVNMAMLATRNVEYAVFVGALVLLAKSPRLRSLKFWIAVAVLSLLLASDRLFLGLSAGGAMIALIGFSLSRSWTLVSLAVRWLIATGLGLLGASIITWLVGSVFNLTHIVGGSSSTPYGLVHGAKNGLEGAIFAVLGFFTNFGANPAAAATEFRQIPHELQHNLLGLGGPAYLINIALVLLGLWLTGRFLWHYLTQSYKNRNINLDVPAKLSSMLVCSAIAALASYVVTQHQFAVDARYLGIALFTVFIAATTFGRNKNWRAEHLVLAGVILTVGIVSGAASAAQHTQTSISAQSDMHSRDELIAQAMKGRHSKVLIGDYWRVLPTKLASSNQLTVWPLSACTQPRTVLTSEAWRPELTTHGFAYLLTFDRGLTDYPDCNLKEVLAAYGRPNASLPISGTLSNPKELLLFYDHGTHKSAPLIPQPRLAPATILPISTDELPNTTCDGPTVMNIVAHQDDDLLFMSPDLLHDVKAGRCVRTIYLTAGDSGSDKFYWLSRQQGSEAAYSSMTGSSSAWVQRIVKLSDKEYVTVANMRGNPNVSLVFMNLPDGNLKGEGFPNSRHESLVKLLNGQIPVMHAVDGQSTFSSDGLVAALAKLMHVYQPAEIRAQSDVQGRQFTDHADHLATSHFAQKAHATYEQRQFSGLVRIPFKRYIGYPVHEMPANISGQDLADKQAAFLIYAKYDGATCHSIAACSNTSVYGFYLTRQYQEK